MGIHANISATKWPKQGRLLGAKVNVCFNYDPDVQFAGVIVRDDAEEPFRTIIHMPYKNRFVEAVECMYQVLEWPREPVAQ